MNKIEIPLSKTKIVLTIVGSMFFVAAGFYFFIFGTHTILRHNPPFVKCVSIASILFFSATCIYGIIKMFDHNIGLTIDDNGIIDNTNASSIGLIRWSDITKIVSENVMSTRFLLLFVKDPDIMLGEVRGMKRKLMAANMKMYGTPISITSTTLKYNFTDLESLIKKRFDEYQKGTQNR